MLIEIDLDEAKKLHITMNQFCLLRFLVDNVNIKPYQSVIQIDDNDIQNLKLQKNRYAGVRIRHKRPFKNKTYRGMQAQL